MTIVEHKLSLAGHNCEGLLRHFSFPKSKFQSSKSSGNVSNGTETGGYDFDINGIYAWDTITIGNLTVNNHPFLEAIEGSAGLNVIIWTLALELLKIGNYLTSCGKLL